MAVVPKLTTIAACRVARVHRDRFNEHVAAGHFECAPKTVPGRARLFDPDDMIALWLFRELMDDGLDARRAGAVACAVALEARLHPDEKSITYVQDYFGPDHGTAVPTSLVPAPDDWDKVLFSGSDIRKTTTFNIAKIRALIAHYTEEERSIIGPDDD
ncbi:MAG: hypothetical protein J7498_03160 [Sphingobium sp.]|nr:hypothetical protein [Sphingobium sp.]